jgi:hypothetical protein
MAVLDDRRAELAQAEIDDAAAPDADDDEEVDADEPYDEGEDEDEDARRPAYR